MKTKYKRNAITNVKPVSTLDGRTTYKPVRRQQTEILTPDEVQLPAQAVTEQIIGTPVDRAWAFNIRTASLAIVIGLAMWIIGGGVIAHFPLFSLAAIAFLVIGFVAVWLVAFLVDARHSPAGLALYNSREYWRFLKREQDERHRRMEDE